MKSVDLDGLLEELVEQVQQGASYREIQPDLIRSIGRRELREQRNLRAAVKATRSKLHQVGGAYLACQPDYAGWVNRLQGLPTVREDPALKGFCLEAMRAHVSTRERLSIIDSFYSTCLASISPVNSILDLACGLNPLSLPWMPLSNKPLYLACDIYGDMVAFLGAFFAHLRQNGRVWSFDLSQGIPDDRVQVVLLLKAIPCLEQLDKSLPLRLMDGIHADHLLVSFPVASLGGRGKGMRANYEAHFMDLIAGRPWQVERHEFPGELAFLVTK
jgi:16S rRNA (guanine(1405)-N(7))-methyltransferase